MEIRSAVVEDLPAVKAIYDHHVLTTISTFDIEPPELSAWEQRLAPTGGPGGHLLVALLDGAVVGYATASAYRPRAAYARTQETSVYVGAEATGRGLGKALYDDLLARLLLDGVHAVLAAVALPNPASEALHERCGFERVGVLREVGWKLGRWVDVAFYERVLTT